MISIITVSYNSRDTIADAMESVWRQMRRGFEVEYIVVAGGSTDGMVDVIKEFESKVEQSTQSTRSTRLKSFRVFSVFRG